MSGVEFSTLYMAQQIDRAHWSPLVICPEEGDLPRRCREAGIETAIVPRPVVRSTSVRLGGLTLVNPLAWVVDAFVIWRAALGLAAFLRTRRPDLVVTKGLVAQFYAGLAARLAGIPCVWHVQDLVSERAGPLFPWVMSLAGRWLARECIADAETIAHQLQRCIPAQRITVVWNGVDTELFSPQSDGGAVRAEWGAPESGLLIGTIGRLTPWKGQSVLIRAFAALAADYPAVRVVLIGSALFDTDAYARSLQAEATRLGVAGRVMFAGFRWDIPQVLAALDIVAHTALEKDSTPLAVVSAMAAGRPIVCSAVDGTAQLFDDGVDGLLTPPGDAQALEVRLRTLLDDPELRLRLGQAARVKAVRELGLPRFARRCEAVFARADALGTAALPCSGDGSGVRGCA